MKQTITLDWDDIEEAIKEWAEKRDVKLDVVSDVHYEGSDTDFDLSIDFEVKQPAKRKVS